MLRISLLLQVRLGFLLLLIHAIRRPPGLTGAFNRAMFDSIFYYQNSLRVFGHLNRWQA